MPQNIFKIFDGRTNFWQWDTKQKLIVLDERITEVRFSNRNMEHSKRRPVYTDNDGLRICNVPDMLLQLPKNLIAYACIKNDDGTCSTVKAVKFAVHRQPIPADYVCEQDAVVEDILMRIELLESLLKDVEQGAQKINRFGNMIDAAKWAKENEASGSIIAVKIDGRWIAHIVEDDFSVVPICDCDGNEIEINISDGGDSDGYDSTEIQQIMDGHKGAEGYQETEEQVEIWDGGGAAGY